MKPLDQSLRELMQTTVPIARTVLVQYQRLEAGSAVGEPIIVLQGELQELTECGDGRLQITVLPFRSQSA